MSINRKMLINIIISVVVLAVLAGAYIWVTNWQKNSAGMTAGGEVIEIFAVDPNDIVRVDIKNSFSEYSIQREGEGDNTVWIVPQYPDIEFSQPKLQLTVSALIGVYAVKKIGTDVKDLNSFGLSSEDITATMHTKDGAQCTLILGDKLSVDSTYYLMKKGDTTVYTVSDYTASSILKIPNDYRETNKGGIDVATVQEFTVSKGGQKIIEFKKFSDNDETSEIDMIDLKMTYPYNERIRSDLFEAMIAPFGAAVEVIDFVSDDLSKKSEYGLDSGYVVVLKDVQKVHTLTFGDISDTGYVYAMYNDNGYIFTMDPSMYYAVKDIKPFDYVQKFAHIYNVKTVKSITVTANGKTHKLEINGTEEKPEYKINGKIANDKAFSEAYQAVIGMTFTGMVDDRSKAKDVVCEVVFNMVDGKINRAVYRTYDDRSVMVTRPDGKENIMLKKYVTDMISVLEKVAANPNPAQ